MIVELMESVTAEVVSDAELDGVPRWFLAAGKVIVGPHYSYDEWLKHGLGSIGSSDPLLISGYEEMLFDPENLLLWGVRLRYSEENIPSNVLPVAWDIEQPVLGILRLTSPIDFSLDVSPIRWVAANGDAFACLYEVALAATGEYPLRLRIATDFDLLFAGGVLCGWMLRCPARYLVNSWAEPYAGEPDRETVALLREYMTLVEASNVRQMIWTKDPNMLQRLIDLHTRLGANGPMDRRRVMQQYIEEIVDKFYGLILHGEQSADNNDGSAIS